MLYVVTLFISWSMINGFLEQVDYRTAQWYTGLKGFKQRSHRNLPERTGTHQTLVSDFIAETKYDRSREL